MPHIAGSARRLPHTAGRSGRPKIAQRLSSVSCTQRTPAGLPCGIPGIGELIDGEMQQDSDADRQRQQQHCLHYARQGRHRCHLVPCELEHVLGNALHDVDAVRDFAEEHQAAQRQDAGQQILAVGQAEHQPGRAGHEQDIHAQADAQQAYPTPDAAAAALVAALGTTEADRAQLATVFGADWEKYIPLDNVEGIIFGPRLRDGHRSLVLVSDNNFAASQFTQFLLFEVK